MAFTEKYEKFEVEFDAWSRQWEHDHPEHGTEDDVIGIAVRDGYSTVHFDLTIEQAEEVVALIQAEIDKAKTWTPTEKTEENDSKENQ